MQGYAYQKLNKKETFDEKVFEQILSDLNDCYLTMRNEVACYECDLDNLKEIKASKIKSRTKIGLNLTAIALTLSLMLSIPIFGIAKINNIRKKKATVPQTTYTYEAGKLPEITTERVELKNAEEKKYIVLVEPYNELNYRNITTYDISDIDMSSALDYYNLDLSKIEDKTESIEYKEYYSDIGSSEEVRRLIIKNVDFNDEQKPNYGWIYAIYYLAYIAILLTVEYIYTGIKGLELPVIVGRVGMLKEELEELKDKKGYEKSVKATLEKTINEINLALSKSEELSRRWNEEFEKNIYLMSDPSLLLSKYDELMKEIKENTMKLEI